MKAKTEDPPVQITKPETFILESLHLDDEKEERLDGKILFEILKMQGKEPIYYYFRTKKELSEFSDIFRNSGYRYLHLSCHGSTDLMEFSFESCAYSEFAQIFEKKLNNRRIFISGCSLGNRRMAEALFEKNGGMYSMTAPSIDVRFNQTTTFWPTFYYMMHAYDESKMKKGQLEKTFGILADIFELKLAHYFRNMGKGAAVDEQIFEGKSEWLTSSLLKSAESDSVESSVND